MKPINSVTGIVPKLHHSATFTDAAEEVTNPSPQKTDHTATNLKGQLDLPPETIALRAELNECIEGIEGHFKKTLETHEQDFLNAYKIYMLKVQKELTFLKEKSNEANKKLSNDDRIT